MNPKTKLDSERLLFPTEHRAIWLVAIIGLSLSFASLWLIRQQLAAKEQLDFEWVAHNRIRALNHGIDNGLLAVTMLRDFYTASDAAEPEEFKVFSESLLARCQGIEKLVWVSRTTGPGSKVGVEEASRFNPSLESGQPSYTFRLDGGGEQPGYFTLTNIVTDRSDEFALDSNPLFIPMLQQAMDSGEMAASGRVDWSSRRCAMPGLPLLVCSLGVLSAGVAHEINNPNNAIQFNASLVSRAWNDLLPILREYYEDHGDFALGG